VQEVDGGTQLVAQAAENLAAMLEAARENNELMVSIADKSKAQASAIEQINTAVREMDETTQHNAALVEETNAAIEQTESQALELDRIVDVFKTFGGAAKSAAQSAPQKASEPQDVKAQQSRAQSFASSGNAALKVEDEWSEF
jgi:methyl-accepting chemotaxis protein